MMQMNSLVSNSARRLANSLPKCTQRWSTATAPSTTASSTHINHRQSFATTIAARSFSSTTPVAASALDQFRDSVDRQTRASEPVGRSWRAKELRRKSYDDLHKLWYVLYKEKNMLLTEQQLSKRRQLIFPQPDRLRKVRKSMGAIKQVLGERKREAIAEHAARTAMNNSEDMMEE